VEWSSVLPMTFAGIELEPLPRPCGIVRGFRLGVNRHDEVDRCWAEFDPVAHDRVQLAGFLGRLTAFAGGLAAEPDRRIRDTYTKVVSAGAAEVPGFRE